MKKKLLLLTALMMSAFIVQAQQLRLHYDRPATFFEEALVIGNGTLGGIIYGGTDVDRISLNDITLWTGEPEHGVYSPEAYKSIPEVRAALDSEDYKLADDLQHAVQGHFSENYQPLGELQIKHNTMGEVTDYERWLDIENAVAYTSYIYNGHQYTTEYFTSHPDQGMVMRLTTTNPQGLDVELALSSKLPNTVTTNGLDIMMEGYAAYKSLPVYYDASDKFAFDPNRGIHFRTRVHAVKNDSKTMTVYLVNATSFNGFDKDPVKEGRDYKTAADNLMKHLLDTDYASLRERHVDDYRSIFSRVSLQLSKDIVVQEETTDRQLLAYVDESRFNPELEALYFQYGRYLLISCSRIPNVPANLQGLWNESILPPWSSNYTTNINLEENYWPAETANMPEMHESLFSFMKELQGSGEKTAKAYYDVNRGWCLAHNTDIWAMTNPVGLNTGSPSWANWNMGGAWVSTHIWEHYAFSLDKAFLAEYYPVLKGAAEFCLGWLIEKDGKLLTSPSTSPENIFVTDEGYHGATCYGGAADLAMVRECLIDAKNAALELGTDKAFVKELESTIARIAPYKIGHRGNLQEWYHDWNDEDPTHRHQSHLFGLYPGHNFNDGVHTEQQLKNAAARTLEIKGDKTTGWSTGWRVNLFARLGDAKNAYHIYRKLLNYISPDKYHGSDARRGGGTYPNLLDAHSPFQIDGNFGGCAGVVEMLMQSRWGKTPEMVLLPALPENWKDGKVSGIRARGGYTVSMEWESGRVTTLIIEAQRAGKLRLTCNGKTRTLKLKAGKQNILL